MASLVGFKNERDVGKTMITSDTPLQEPMASEVAATLIDLSKLGQRAGSESGKALSEIAHEMLRRVLTACQADRGAVLLAVAGDIPAGPRYAPFQDQVKDPRVLALYNMREEDIHPLLGVHVPVRQNLQEEQTDAQVSCWITYRQPLSSNHSNQSLHALLALGWTGMDSDACAAAVARGQKMLPLLTDMVASVIVTLLQAERLDELEQFSMQKSIDEMELFKAELLGTVSHELRSPLASIKGYAATLLRHERRLAREERHHFLLAIVEASDRLERIIERLLEVSQLETDAITIQSAPVDVALLSREAITSLQENLPEDIAGNFTFAIILKDADGEPARSVPLARADPRRLREVLDNILENAIKYSPGGGTVTVGIRPVTVEWPLARGADASRGGYVGGSSEADTYVRDDSPVTRKIRSMLEVCVCDTGIGIPPEHIERIFDRFYRVDMRLTREVNGLGLGLTISRRIVELHGGTIWAESLPEGGSVFTMLLPQDNG